MLRRFPTHRFRFAVAPRPWRHWVWQAGVLALAGVCPLQAHGHSAGERPIVATFYPRQQKPTRVHLELARTPAQMARGLMHRRHLPKRHGMLFAFDTSERRAFWMKDTFVSLDLIFIDAQCRVVDIIADAMPQSTQTHASRHPAQYVVELHAGSAKQFHIEVGTPIAFALGAKALAECPPPAP